METTKVANFPDYLVEDAEIVKHLTENDGKHKPMEIPDNRDIRRDWIPGAKLA